MRSARELVVFVASPSDCTPERAMVAEAAATATDVLGASQAILLRVTGWEAVAPELGRPQEIINPLVDECDVFIGLMKREWGSPTGSHPSGFIEEFERAFERHSKTNTPRVAMWFGDVPAELLNDAGPKLRKVLSFQDRFRKERLGLHGTFSSADDLRSKLLLYFIGLIRDIAGSSDDGEEGARAAKPRLIDDEGLSATEDVDDARRQLAEAFQHVADVALATAETAHIDRDRLLLAALGLNGDGGLLPVHVTNRLFRRRFDLTLSVMESEVWLKSIVAAAGDEAASRTTPGWAVLEGVPLSRLLDDIAELAESDDGRVARGVFDVLRRADARPDTLWKLTSATDDDPALRRWKSALENNWAAIPARRYLATLGTLADDDLLAGIERTADDTEVGAIRSLLKGDPNPLARTATKAYSAPPWKTELLVSAADALEDDTLLAVVAATRAPAPLRQAATRLALDRQLLHGDVLTAALASNDLVDLVFEAAEQSEALKPEMRAAADAIDKNVSGRSRVLDRVQGLVTSADELFEIARSGTLAGADAWQALSWYADDSHVAFARDVFDSGGDLIANAYLDYEGWGDDKLSILEYLRRQARIAALRVLVRSPAFNDADNDRLRSEATRKLPYGHEDVDLLLMKRDSPDDVDTLLAGLETTYFAVRDRVLERALALGGERAAASVLANGRSEDRAVVVRALAQSEAPNEELKTFLSDDNGEARIAAVRALHDRMSRDELVDLLHDYGSAGWHYYNVVAELDRLLYAPEAQSAVTSE